MNKERILKTNNESFLKRFGAGILFLALLFINIFFTRNFFHINTLWNAVLQSTSVMLISMGMMLIIATGGIDVSMGSMVALSSTITVTLWHAGYGIGAIAIAVMLCGLVGGFSGIIIHKFKIQPMIVTLGLMTSVRGAAQLIASGRMIQLKGKALLDFGYYRIFDAIPIQLVVIIIAITAFYIIAYKTKLGAYIEAYGDNPRATLLSGVRTGVLIIIVYALGGMMSGVAGINETIRMGAADPNNTGLNMEMDAIAATAIGGTPMNGGKPHVFGTVIGVLFMQLITMMVNMNNIPFQASLIVKAIIIILALYIQNAKSTKKKLAVNNHA